MSPCESHNRGRASDYGGGGHVSVIALLSLGGAVGVNARMHIQNGLSRASLSPGYTCMRLCEWNSRALWQHACVYI